MMSNTLFEKFFFNLIFFQTVQLALITKLPYSVFI